MRIATLLLGVTFALLDLAEQHPMHLRRTTIMETGGMKGRRPELVRDELHTTLRQAFGVPAVHSEYGMTELLSQAWSTGQGLYRCPPWMRVVARGTDDPAGAVAEPRHAAALHDDAAAALLVEHAGIGVVGVEVGLIALQHPLAGLLVRRHLLAPVLDAGVAAGEPKLHLQVEVAGLGAAKDDEGVLLDRIGFGAFADDGAILDCRERDHLIATEHATQIGGARWIAAVSLVVFEYGAEQLIELQQQPGIVLAKAPDNHAEASSRDAFSTSSAWPGTFTLRQARTTSPSAPMR